MSLVTLKRYLFKTEGEVSHRKVIFLLLNGIAEHGVCADSTELESFRDEMQAISAAAEADCSLEQLFVAAGATVHALESSNTRTKRLMHRQGIEFQNMIAMLAQTVISITDGGERYTEALNDIKHELKQADAIEDVEKLKLRLGVCLEKVRTEATRQKSEAAALVLELQRNIQHAESCTNPDADPVTGLPNASAAKLAFAQALASPGRKYVVTMVIDRLQPLNARFGNGVGDEVIRHWQKYIQMNVLVPGDHLFRWGGPTLVALITRPDSIDQIRGDLKRVLDKRLEKEFDVGGRTALIPLSVAWSAMALIPPASNVPLFLDKFVAAQIPRDYS
jgi:GGDEF domain-containing protein